jgi:hypothetical protein
MNNRSRQAMLRILLLLQEFSAEELDEAIKHLGGMDKEGLLAFIDRLCVDVRAQPQPARKIRRPAGIHRLEALEQTDPEKYALLSRLKEEINQGRVLRTLDDIRSLGKSLSKSFQPGKSHREAAGRLIALLSEGDVPFIRNAISVLPRGEQSSDKGYERLAEGLMRGTDRKREQ